MPAEAMQTWLRDRFAALATRLPEGRPAASPDAESRPA
jgi:hypothetical protein